MCLHAYFSALQPTQTVSWLILFTLHCYFRNRLSHNRKFS